MPKLSFTHTHTHKHIYIYIYMICKHILSITFLNEPELFVCKKELVCSIWHIDRTLSGAITLGQSGPRTNSNEGLLQIFKAGASQSDGLMSYPGLVGEGVLAFCRDAVGVFYSPSRLSLLLCIDGTISSNSKMINQKTKTKKKLDICVLFKWKHEQ